MQYTQACIYTYNVCYPIIGVYVYMYTGTLDTINTSAVFEIALVGQVNNPLAVPSVKWKVTTIFYLPLKLQQSAPQPMTHRTNTAKFTPKWYILTTVSQQSLDWTSYFVAEHFDVVLAEARLCSILDYLLWLLCFWDSSRPISSKSLICYSFIF